jgi:hypothetical protein
MDRIGMDVLEFLAQLIRAVNVEVEISALPETAQFTGQSREIQRELAGRPAFSRAHGARHPLLQDLHNLCKIPLFRLTDKQVDVLGHDYVTKELRSTAVSYFSQNLHEEIASSDGAQELPPLVAAKGDEMQVTLSVVPLKFSGHEEKNLPPSPKLGR